LSRGYLLKFLISRMEFWQTTGGAGIKEAFWSPPIHVFWGAGAELPGRRRLSGGSDQTFDSGMQSEYRIAKVKKG
jgi:hypothetical protein